MDPRSPALPQTLAQQLQWGQRMFKHEEARRALAEINSAQKQLSDLQKKLGGNDVGLKSALTEAQSELSNILTIAKTPGQPVGLQQASQGLVSGLQVVESGDRPVPSQAIALFQASEEHVESRITQWIAFKHEKLPRLNQQLQHANLVPVAISEIEQEVQLLMTR
jgi:hypothetical protein